MTLWLGIAAAALIGATWWMAGFGRFAGSPIRLGEDAESAAWNILVEAGLGQSIVATEASVEASGRPEPHFEHADPPGRTTDDPAFAFPLNPTESFRDKALDAGVPGSAAFAIGVHNWLTPDPAAIAALEQLTHDHVASALDLRRVLREKSYALWTDDSLLKWRGHVGEQQVLEQVASWAPSEVDAPDASNAEGPDVTLFDAGYQVKIVGDFRGIENPRNETLIVNDDAQNVPEDALHIDLSQPFEPASLREHEVVVAEGISIDSATEAWESAAGEGAGGLDAEDLGDAADVVPGIGSAFRVAMIGVKRASAIRDDRLRGRALKRAGLDAVEAILVTTTAGVIGGAAGSAVDAGTGGLTLGVGSVTGATGATAQAGRWTAKRARQRDMARISAARVDLKTAVANYERETDRLDVDLCAAWQQGVEVQQVALERRRDLCARDVDYVRTRALKSLEETAVVDFSDAQRLLAACKRDLDRGWRTGIGVKAIRARRTWSREMKQLELTSNTVRAECVLRLAGATDSGLTELRTWAEERVMRRAVISAATSEVCCRVTDQALVHRTDAVAELREQRASLSEERYLALAPAVADVRRAARRTEDELQIAGPRTRSSGPCGRKADGLAKDGPMQAFVDAGPGGLPCDHRCMSAVEDVCHCMCGGVNHGVQQNATLA